MNYSCFYKTSKNRALHLKLVKNFNAVDLEKAQMDFSIYEMDLLERQSRIPKLKELYQLKLERLAALQIAQFAAV